MQDFDSGTRRLGECDTTKFAQIIRRNILLLYTVTHQSPPVTTRGNSCSNRANEINFHRFRVQLETPTGIYKLNIFIRLKCT